MARRDRRSVFIAALAALLVCGVISLAQAGSRTGNNANAAPPQGSVPIIAASTVAPAPSDNSTPPTAPAATSGAAVTSTSIDDEATDPSKEVDLAGDETNASGGCTIKERSLRQGSSGDSVTCLQQALITSGYLSGSPTGSFDSNTYSAVRKVQTERDMFVDGIVGRETAISLGVWPDEASLVIHTPKPAKGAMDLLGYPLSSVAVSGPDAPPLPANSGSGKRLVYDRAGQRVWAVDKNERIIRSWLVAGSKYSNEEPGVHHVYSKSEVSTAWNGKAYLPLMVRYQKTDIGNIGFHGIPTHVADGTAYMTEAELGQRLSGGCQRQAMADARFVWDFADIGTTVVVI